MTDQDVGDQHEKAEIEEMWREAESLSKSSAKASAWIYAAILALFVLAIAAGSIAVSTNTPQSAYEQDLYEAS